MEPEKPTQPLEQSQKTPGVQDKTKQAEQTGQPPKNFFKKHWEVCNGLIILGLVIAVAIGYYFFWYAPQPSGVLVLSLYSKDLNTGGVAAYDIENKTFNLLYQNKEQSSQPFGGVFRPGTNRMAFIETNEEGVSQIKSFLPPSDESVTHTVDVFSPKLGLQWSPSGDILTYSATKRQTETEGGSIEAKQWSVFALRGTSEVEEPQHLGDGLFPRFIQNGGRDFLTVLWSDGLYKVSITNGATGTFA